MLQYELHRTIKSSNKLIQVVKKEQNIQTFYIIFLTAVNQL